MRILQIGPIPPELGGQTQGGVASNMWGLIKHLVEQGHQVGVLADNYYSKRKVPKLWGDVQIYGIVHPFLEVPTLAFSKPSFWRKVISIKRHFGPLKGWLKIIGWLLIYQRVIDKFQPDIIHVHHLETRFPFAYFAIGNRIPIVAMIHSTHSIAFSNPPLRELQYLLVQRNLNLACNLIFVSQFVKLKYEKLFPNYLNGCRTWIIYNPVEVSTYYVISQKEARQHIDEKLDYPIILSVGNLIPRKGVQFLIEAASKLKNKGLRFRLIIVGDGPQRDELEMLIQEKGLISLISLKGAKSQKELLYYYNAADLFVSPSLMESFGIVFIEAMLCGCPVIGTPEVLDELLPSTDYGCRIPPNDIEALAETIEKALQKSWNRDKIRSYALNFDWKVSIHKFEQVYCLCKSAFYFKK